MCGQKVSLDPLNRSISKKFVVQFWMLTGRASENTQQFSSTVIVKLIMKIKIVLKIQMANLIKTSYHRKELPRCVGVI